jgi:hypothetical protein
MPTKHEWLQIKKDYPMTEVKLTCDPVFYRVLDFLAEQYAVNRSKLVRTLIYEYQRQQEENLFKTRRKGLS